MDISIHSRPGAIPVLLYVSRNPGCGKTSPSYTPGGCIDHSREARINEFIECGLMEIDLHGRTKHRKSLYLTLKGREVSERLEEIERLLGEPSRSHGHHNQIREAPPPPVLLQIK